MTNPIPLTSESAIDMDQIATVTASKLKSGFWHVVLDMKDGRLLRARCSAQPMLEFIFDKWWRTN